MKKMYDSKNKKQNSLAKFLAIIIILTALFTSFVGIGIVSSRLYISPICTGDITPPVVTNPSANPPSIPADGVTMSRLNVTVKDDGVVVDKVTVDLSDIGGEDITAMNLTIDIFYTIETTAAEGTSPGKYHLKVNATDIYGNYNNMVDITLEITASWDPWVYDTRPPYGVIDKREAIDAINDYFAGKITKEQAIGVILLYFG